MKHAVPGGALGRLGGFSARHRRWVAAAWLVVVVVAGWLNAADKDNVSNSLTVPHSDSQAAYDLLQKKFASQNAATATVVFAVPAGQKVTDAPNAAAIAAAVQALGAVDGVAAVADPLDPAPSEQLEQIAAQLPPSEIAALEAGLPPSVSADGTTAYTTVTMKGSVNNLLEEFPDDPEKPARDYPNPYASLQRALDALPRSDVQIAIGGVIADTWNQPVSWWASHADEVGLAIGALLLLVAFGSLFGMLIPIGVALLGATTASGLVYFFARFATVSSAAPAVTLMISIGVGLDYSLLIVTRFRQYLADGHPPETAVPLAVGTAGRAATFAGATVVVALLGLVLVPIPLVQTLGVAAAIGVTVMMIAATTLLPALLGFAGSRIDRFRFGQHRTEGLEHPEQTFWGRFAHAVSGKPWLTIVVGTLVLAVLAMPFLHIEFGMPDDTSLPGNLSQRTAYAEMTRAFGPGVNGPLIVAAGLPKGVPYAQAVEQLAPVSTAVAAFAPAGTLEGVRYSVGPVPNDTDTTTAVIYQITPTTGPDDPETAQLVDRLRADLARVTKETGIDAHVGGETATLIDLTDLVQRYLPIVIGAVVLGAFLLLILVFRSILVPLKAAVMNLVSIAAAYGVVVVVFQWGWGKGLVGLGSTIPIVSFVPLVMFVILFGLSMDYEVFLMSRIKEEWDRTHEPRTSVVLGLANTARVITVAALIMIAVFSSFVANPNPTVKLIGFGMAVAVLIDATILRMFLVPAVMEVLGRAAWWFPGWLGWLPHLDVEGTSVAAGTQDTAQDGAETPRDSSTDPSMSL